MPARRMLEDGGCHLGAKGANTELRAGLRIVQFSTSLGRKSHNSWGLE